MKIYVFTCHAALNHAYMGTNTKVFRTKRAVLDAFKEWREEEMRFIEWWNWTILIDEERHMEAYTGDDYCANHTEGFIEEFEI